MTRRVTRRAGFTLPELMLSIVLLAVGMLSVASLMAASHRQQRLAVSRGGLSTLAEAKLEELRSYAYAPAASALRNRLAVGGSLTSNASGYSDEATAPNGHLYDRRWQVTNDLAPLGVRRVTIRLVARTAARYEVSSVDFSTLVWFQ